MHPGRGSSLMFDPESGSFARTSTASARQLANSESAPTLQSEPEESTDLWWLWLIVGLAAASAVIVPTMLLTRPEEQVIQPDPEEPTFTVGF